MKIFKRKIMNKVVVYKKKLIYWKIIIKIVKKKKGLLRKHLRIN